MSKKGVRDYRPKLHFTTEKGWINDPNGLVYENGNYHLFYQYYPYDTKWGPMHWGHAISKDLIRWEHLPVALAPDDLGFIFSGSAVYDSENTSGFASFGKPPIVAMFTHSGETQQQSIAYSTDGVNFIKYEGNPVIKNPGIKDFRDPKVFYNPIRDSWSCVVVAGDRAHFYASQDLIHWEKTGEFGPEGNRCPGIWECPDIFPLKAPNGEEVWVLVVSMTIKREEGGPKTQYFLGTFDGDTFICDKPFDGIEWIDPGFDNYAAMSYYGEDLKDRIIIGWGANWVYAADTPTNEYCGTMTLARKLSLVDTPAGLRLSSIPYKTLGNIAGAPTIIESQKELDEEVFGLRIKANGEFSIVLSNENQEKLVFGVNSKNEIFMDRSQAGDNSFNEHYASNLFSNVVKQRFFSGPITMEAVFDVSILEVFADKGTFASAQLVYPTKPYNKITVIGDAQVYYYNFEF
ncbi:MAG: glycoside hydrolase family 32 protein [Clostridiales bacterium]|nr:glycoside hydrolase family 32 protein [Clostridiales bacterium]